MPLQNDLNSGSPLPLSESRLPRRNRNDQRFTNEDDAHVRRTNEKVCATPVFGELDSPPCIYMGARDKETRLRGGIRTITADTSSRSAYRRISCRSSCRRAIVPLWEAAVFPARVGFSTCLRSLNGGMFSRSADTSRSNLPWRDSRPSP